MKSLTVAVALAIACTLMGPRPAQAWHEVGHMAVALIAYRQLSDTEQQKVQSVLQKHPHYKTFLSACVPSDAKKDEWVVMQAAIWPDWVRATKFATPEKEKITKSFSHPDWHYVNKPIVYTDGASPAEKKAIEANINDDRKDRGQLLTKFPQLVGGFKGANDADLVNLVWADKDAPSPLETDEAKAVALCWILHLAGDSHQPLHAATFFSKHSKDGDRGGNAYNVLWEGRAVDLHSIWDGGFGWDKLKGFDESRYGAVDGLARDLLSRIKPTAKELETAALESWVNESLDLAKTKAYFPQGVLLPGSISVGQHHPHADDLDPLPAGYGKSVRTVAEGRVVLAGFRTGTLLKDLVKN